MRFPIEKEIISLFYAADFASRQNWHKKVWQQIGDYIITDWIKNPVGVLERVVKLNERGKILARELITLKHHIRAFNSPGLAISVKQVTTMNFSSYTRFQYKIGMKYIFGRDILIKENYPSEGCVTAIIDNLEERYLRFSEYINWHVDKNPELIKNPVAKEIWLNLVKHSDLLWDNHNIELTAWGFSDEEE